MLKIRLMRIGGKKKPFYRVVAVDERSKRTGGYVELLGTYNPLTEPKEIKLKQDRIDYWIKMGAQPSVGYLRIIGKAPQRPPRKAKKEKKEEAPLATQAPAEPAAEALKEETPKQEEATNKSEEVATEAKSGEDSPLSEPGEDGQSAQAMTSTTPSEPVPPQAEGELENQDQTSEGATPTESAKEEKKDERPS